MKIIFKQQIYQTVQGNEEVNIHGEKTKGTMEEETVIFLKMNTQNMFNGNNKNTKNNMMTTKKSKI